LFLSARRTSFHASYNTQVMPECGMTFRQLAPHPRATVKPQEALPPDHLTTSDKAAIGKGRSRGKRREE